MEYQPLTPSIAGLEGGGEDGLDEGLAGLEVLAAMGAFILRESSLSAGMSTVRLGAPLTKGMPSLSAAQA